MRELDITFLFIMLGIGAAIFTALWYLVLVPTQKFYEKCEALEKEIKTQDNKDRQISRLLKLDKDSWHRTTGERIRELALMIEVKYSIILLKR